MAIKQLPDRDLLLKLLHYDPETGEFVWLPRPPDLFPTAAQWKRWNSRHAGTKAGYLKTNGYTTIAIFGVAYKAHRLAYLIMHGEPVPDLIDHKDRKGSHNVPTNLRAATTSENMANRKANRNSTTGIKGIQKIGRSFRVQIMREGIRHTRTFPNIEDAICYRRRMTQQLHGEFARN